MTRTTALCAECERVTDLPPNPVKDDITICPYCGDVAVFDGERWGSYLPQKYIDEARALAARIMRGH